MSVFPALKSQVEEEEPEIVKGPRGGVWEEDQNILKPGRGIARRRGVVACGPVLLGGQSDEAEKRPLAASTCRVW